MLLAEWLEAALDEVTEEGRRVLMESLLDEVSVKGKIISVPSVMVNGRIVIITGTWLKMATVKDEDLCEGRAVDDPNHFVAQLSHQPSRVDLFTFAEPFQTPTPQYDHYWEWDNVAAIPIKGFADWWENRLSQETRRNVRRAGKHGVVVRPVEFDAALVQGIHDIYNETPFRQGRRFWHYGKDLESVRNENASYLDRSEFLGAFHEGKLIGFVKLVYVDRVASIMQILSRTDHADKRPSNALVAKAVEVAANRNMGYLTYCKYVYGKSYGSPLTEFKRRNGFDEIRFPRYYVPLTVRGKVCLRLGLHHGWRQLLPPGAVATLGALRTRCIGMRNRKRQESGDGCAGVAQ